MALPALEQNRNRYAFLASAFCGWLIWCFSEEITGHQEPWDGSVSAYLFMLLLTGFICAYVFKSNLRSVYWGGFAGQALFGGVPFFGCILLGYWCEGGGNLFPLGVIFLLAYSLPILLGAVLGAPLRHYRDKRKPTS